MPGASQRLLNQKNFLIENEIEDVGKLDLLEAKLYQLTKLKF